ncbi:hypothetical protein COOONC_05309 [Cooperia oncophora]
MMMCIPGATVRQTTRINVPILFQLVDKTLTTHIWYHGMIPRKEVEDMLKIQGDYLVRKTTVARQITVLFVSETHQRYELSHLRVYR